VYGLALALGWWWLLVRRWKRGPSGVPLREYFGHVPSRPVSAQCIWVHGVSLGEVNATRTLVTELRRHAPDVVVALSSSTRTGLTQARKLYPQHVTFRFPLDFSRAIDNVLASIRPSLIVLMELEVWPNLIERATAAGIPVVIANGRVTAEKSVRRFNWPIARWFARRMFRQIRWVGAQDQTYAQRFVELGVPTERVVVTGSVKYDAADTGDRIEGQEELAAAMGVDTQRPLWVCGSTGDNEEALILDAYERLRGEFPSLQLAVIPRRPERFDEVAQLIVQRGYACLRRSTGAPLLPAGVAEPRPVYLGDTMGELRKFYALATVVFVGRSLVPMGGSDVMEVAGLAKPVLVGPYTDNFVEAVGLLLAEGGAARTASVAELAATIASLLKEPQRCRQMGLAARATVVRRRGATAATVETLLAMLR
jgi:3-deoxy-D-manno-octulosonic-acid transferase